LPFFLVPVRSLITNTITTTTITTTITTKFLTPHPVLNNTSLEIT